MVSLKKLPAETIKLISSSQVITSPYTVVKELVENSLDSGCDKIDVRLEGNGLEKIEVQDNGSGIPADDVPFVCQPNFTNKISSECDLSRLSTFGFRGEALHSLCTVADVTIATKTSDDPVCKCYAMDHDGFVSGTKLSHHDNGTTVCVVNLFKKLPVRLQVFRNARKVRDELKLIEELLMGYGLTFPRLLLTFRHNKFVIWQKERSDSMKGALNSIFGCRLVDSMHLLEIKAGEMEIRGAVPRKGSDFGVTGRTVCDRMFVSVNKRPVIVKKLSSLLKKCYCGGHVGCGNRYPISVLHITVPSNLLDVNLEPNKTRVLIQNMDSVIRHMQDYLENLYEITLTTKKCVAELDSNKDFVSTLDSAERSLLDSSADEADTTGRCNRPPDQEAVRSRLPRLGSCSLRDDSTISCSAGSEDQRLASLLGRQIESANCEAMMPVGRIGCEIILPGHTSDVAYFDVSTSRVSEIVSPCKDACIPSGLKGAPSSSIVLHQKSNIEEIRDLFPSQLATPVITDMSWSKGHIGGNKLQPVALLQGNHLPQQRLSGDCLVPPIRQTLGLFNGGKENRRSKNAVQSDSLEHPTAGKRKRMSDSSSPKETKLKSFPAQVRSSELELSRLKCDFSLEELRKSCKRGKINRSDYDHPVAVAGLHGTSIWFVLLHKKLLAFDRRRAKEVSLFDKLSKSHIVPAAKLEVPMLLSERELGAEGFRKLTSMKKTTDVHDLKRYVTDERLLSNGFRISHRQDISGCDRYELTHAASCIPGYGVQDLLDVLAKCNHTDGDVTGPTLQDSRPARLIAWLQEEAVRLARQSTDVSSLEEMNRLLNRFAENGVDVEKLACLHRLPVAKTITILR